MSTGTPATRALTSAKAAFRLIEYEYISGQDRIGVHAAEAIGMPAELVLKTLMVEVDGKPACAVNPADRSLSMKRVASAFGGKSAQMMPPDKAERLTGFHTGGISPFGQKRNVPTAFEESALQVAEIVLNAGKRGLMVVLAPEEALRVSGGEAKALCAE